MILFTWKILNSHPLKPKTFIMTSILQIQLPHKTSNLILYVHPDPVYVYNGRQNVVIISQYKDVVVWCENKRMHARGACK